MTGAAPYHLLDDGFAPPGCEVLVVGCGNLLRADDSVGPRLVRLLWAGGVPDGVRLVDGGTAGMDVAFQMRGAGRVVLVDAATTGSPPGTVFRVPGEELAGLPPLTGGVHPHAFRWDHALALARWLLGPSCPTDVTVFLIEAADTGFGEHLTPGVERAMHHVAGTVRREFLDPCAGTGPAAGRSRPDRVELTGSAHLRIGAELARRHFPSGACAAVREGSDLVLVPLHSEANGGLVLKERTPAGDRSVLLREVLGEDLAAAAYPARWEADRGVLRIDLSCPE
jgi:hydrogenase maturation protease